MCGFTGEAEEACIMYVKEKRRFVLTFLCKKQHEYVRRPQPPRWRDATTTDLRLFFFMSHPSAELMLISFLTLFLSLRVKWQRRFQGDNRRLCGSGWYRHFTNIISILKMVLT
ncbi:hypothetical protein Zmor_005672 [Zophobas morio]|uniref:Uncharacterized protein n=1 Tax=Zophobas morio TaxID=2755281 RepID=A0AA38MMF7_9CUCU|nr:hypothetical protein Zmor_005672 [Zophobas morio]